MRLINFLWQTHQARASTESACPGWAVGVCLVGLRGAGGAAFYRSERAISEYKIPILGLPINIRPCMCTATQGSESYVRCLHHLHPPSWSGHGSRMTSRCIRRLPQRRLFRPYRGRIARGVTSARSAGAAREAGGMEPPALPQGRQGGMEPPCAAPSLQGAWSPSAAREAGGVRGPLGNFTRDSCFPQDPSQ